MDFSIMATLEEYDEENHGQSTENETQSEPRTQCSQPISHTLQTDIPREEKNNPQPSTDSSTQHNGEPLWEMNFDGSCTRKNARVGVWLRNTENDHAESHAVNFHFKCTNNIAEYEALILGLNLLKKLGTHRIAVKGDSELVIKQVNGEYTAKRPRLRAYRNDAVDLLKTFVEYELVFVPRSQNVIANGLACLASSYPKTPPDQKIIIQTKFRPVVPDNEKYWQVFEGDK